MQGEQENTTQPTMMETAAAKIEEAKTTVVKAPAAVAAEWDAGVTKAAKKAAKKPARKAAKKPAKKAGKKK
jgi:hypothetical protein